MARIAGVDLPKKKHMERALTYIHGIGLTSARKILDEAGLSYDTNSDDLTDGDIAKIRKILEERYHVEGDRRREVSMDIKRLMDSGCYRGLRHRKGLPAGGSAQAPMPGPGRGPAAAQGSGENNQRQQEPADLFFLLIEEIKHIPLGIAVGEIMIYG